MHEQDLNRLAEAADWQTTEERAGAMALAAAVQTYALAPAVRDGYVGDSAAAEAAGDAVLGLARRFKAFIEGDERADR